MQRGNVAPAGLNRCGPVRGRKNLAANTLLVAQGHDHRLLVKQALVAQRSSEPGACWPRSVLSP